MTKLREFLLPGEGADKKHTVGVDFVVDYGSTPPLPDEINNCAMRVVAMRATNAADARLLLETLGLIEPAAHPALSDCDPAMPRTTPFDGEVNAYINRFNGRFIANVPTGGLL